MTDDAGERRLADLERNLRFQIASGVYDRWIDAGEDLSVAPPWYEAALEIVRLRVSLHCEDPAMAARSLFRGELSALDARLAEALRRSRDRDDWVGYQFGEIHRLIAPPRSLEERFLAFALNAPAGPLASGQTAAVSGGAKADAETPAQDSRPEAPAADCVAERKGLIRAYKEECRAQGVKVTDKMIAKAARPTWDERTPIQRWARNDPRSSLGDDAAIRRVFRTRPHLKNSK